jgi:hypothetical protein
MKFNNSQIFFGFAFIFYVVFDCLSTVICLSNPNTFELSPVANFFSCYIDFTSSLLIGKLFICCLIVAYYCLIEKFCFSKVWFYMVCFYLGCLGLFALFNNVYLYMVA